MRRIVIVISLLISLILLLANQSGVLANGEEVKRGEEIWQKLSADQSKCENLIDGEFENLGEFFMERMVGSPDSHEIMDKQMAQMMGEEGLEQMHTVMGKRMSGCQTDAVVTGAGMMGMMGSAFAPWSFGGTKGGGWNMMGPGMMGWGNSPAGWGVMGSGTLWIWSLLSWITWILIIVALVAFIRWMWKKGSKK